MLGKRDTDMYGSESLDEINACIASSFPETEFVFLQSNIEGELVSYIQQADGCDGIVLNAGAYSHYSYAIRDAIDAVSTPCVEVHMTNIYAREQFRRTSVLTEVCRGSISGFGKDSYRLAVEALI